MWGMSPKQFWRLTPREFYWLLEARKPVKMYGKLTEHEVAEMYRDVFGEPETAEE